MAKNKKIRTQVAPKPQANVKVAQSSVPNPWLYMLPALVLALLVFGQTIGFDFVNWDDDVNILENRNVTTFDFKGIWTETVIGNYNPLTILTFAIEHAMAGTNASLYHFNNIWLHLLNVTLVFFLGRQLRLNLWAAGLLAALFAIHPMRVESVAWITERKDVLFAAFYFGAMLVYERSRQAGKESSWHWGVATLFMLALLSKIQAVSLPLSLICLDYLRQREIRWSEVLAKAPYFLMSLAIGLLGVYFLGRDGSLDEVTDYSFVDRLAVGAYALVIYLVKAVIPYEHSPLYPYPSVLPTIAYVSLGISLAFIALVVYSWRRKWIELTFGLALFAVNVVFMLQVLGAGQGYLADRFTYVGYLGLFWLFAYGFQQLYQKSPSTALRIGVGIYVLTLSLLAFRQTRIWASGDTLWAHVSELYPKVATAFGNRGLWLRERGQPEKALDLLTKAIEAAPTEGTYYNSRGKLHFDQGRVIEAIEDYSEGIKRKPDLGELYINRGAAYAQRGVYPRAEADLNKGIELDPDNFNGYSNRSLLYFTTGRAEMALKDYEWMLEQRPERHDFWYERGTVLKGLGRTEEGNASIRKAIQIAGKHPQVAQYRASLSE